MSLCSHTMIKRKNVWKKKHNELLIKVIEVPLDLVVENSAERNLKRKQKTNQNTTKKRSNTYKGVWTDRT